MCDTNGEVSVGGRSGRQERKVWLPTPGVVSK
jgi:hypothetical protein